jgi:hypothetical protein
LWDEVEKKMTEIDSSAYTTVWWEGIDTYNIMLELSNTTGGNDLSNFDLGAIVSNGDSLVDPSIAGDLLINPIALAVKLSVFKHVVQVERAKTTAKSTCHDQCQRGAVPHPRRAHRPAPRLQFERDSHGFMVEVDLVNRTRLEQAADSTSIIPWG